MFRAFCFLYGSPIQIPAEIISEGFFFLYISSEMILFFSVMKLSTENKPHSRSCGSTHIFIKILVDIQGGRREVFVYLESSSPEILWLCKNFIFHRKEKENGKTQKLKQKFLSLTSCGKKSWKCNNYNASERWKLRDKRKSTSQYSSTVKQFQSLWFLFFS